MNQKDERLLAWCREHGAEGIHLQRRSNVAWISGGADVRCNAGDERGVASVLWTPARKTVLTNRIESRRMADEEFDDSFEVVAHEWYERSPALAGRIASDWPGPDPLADLRAPLDDEEIAHARILGARAAAVVEVTLRELPRGASEIEAAAQIAALLRIHGINAPVLLVAADERIARYRHPVPTDARADTALMAVVCAESLGLVVCMTRMIHFGKIPPDLRRRHDAVCAVDAALHAATNPGARWCDALAVARAEYGRQGFADEWKLHHQGGPMGYECRDFLATPDETRVIRPDQLVGWNPSITGTKSEDCILSSGEVITATQDWPVGAQGRPDILVR